MPKPGTKPCLHPECNVKAMQGFKYCSLHHTRLVNNPTYQSYLTDIPRTQRNMRGTDWGEHGDGTDLA